MKEWLRDHCGNPRGLLGRVILKLMHVEHSSNLRWSIERLDFQPTDIVLDIGCGSGNAVQMVVPMVFKAYGIDRSLLAVEEARRQNQLEIQKGRVEIFQATLDETTFPRESFQLVTAFETVYFWENIEKDFSLIFDLLSPQGKFAIFCGSVSKKGNEDRGPSGFRIWSTQELESCLKNAGFTRVRIENRRSGKSALIIGEK